MNNNNNINSTNNKDLVKDDTNYCHNNNNFEINHVHSVYENIANHFDKTRHKQWPIVENFLLNLPKKSFVLDVGCGNGKYLKTNRTIVTFGVDRCLNLVEICNKKNLNLTLLCDSLHLPFKHNFFDYIICIAVIHHFSSRERRTYAIKEMLNKLKINGTLLIFVWAFEQTNLNKFDVNNNNEQDVFVIWKTKTAVTNNNNSQVIEYNRYYHLFKKGELEEIINETKIKHEIIDSGFDADNWYVMVKKLE